MNMLIVLLCALAQNPAPNPPTRGAEAPQDGWITVDRIVMIVNQDIITELQLLRERARYERKRKLTTDTEIRNANTEILTDIVRKRLRVQAGALLGIDEKLIDARVAESLEQMRKRFNGTVGLRKYLQSLDVDGVDVKRLLRDDIYEQVYRDGVTGEAPGPLGRVTADRYIRPGQLSLLYQQAIERPEEMAALGGVVGRVKFQQIVLDAAQYGGPEATVDLARNISERITAGEDMGALARQYASARDDDGIVEVQEPNLRKLFPEIADFTAQAKSDEISAPMVVNRTDGTRVVRLVRFLERHAAVVPSLEDYTVQTTLRTRAEDWTANYRLESGYRDLLASSYVWPPELAVSKK